LKSLINWYFSSNILLQILNVILDFSEIEAGKIEMETLSIALKELMEDARMSFDSSAKLKNIGLNLAFDSALDNYVSKPFVSDRLLQKIVQYTIEKVA